MNKPVILSILATAVLVAGIFAYMPVEKASTVHTTITADTQANFNDQERMVITTLSGQSGALTDIVILPDNNVDYKGTVDAILTRASGANDVTIECVLGTGAVQALTAADDLDALGEKRTYTLPNDCEAVRVDMAAATLAVLIAIHIDEWPEV